MAAPQTRSDFVDDEKNATLLVKASTFINENIRDTIRLRHGDKVQTKVITDEHIRAMQDRAFTENPNSSIGPSVIPAGQSKIGPSRDALLRAFDISPESSPSPKFRSGVTAVRRWKGRRGSSSSLSDVDERVIRYGSRGKVEIPDSEDEDEEVEEDMDSAFVVNNGKRQDRGNNVDKGKGKDMGSGSGGTRRLSENNDIMPPPPTQSPGTGSLSKSRMTPNLGSSRNVSKGSSGRQASASSKSSSGKAARAAAKVDTPRRRTPAVQTYDVSYVNARPNETFHHLGRGRWAQGMPPEGSSVKMGVRGPGLAAWKEMNWGGGAKGKSEP